MGVNQGTRQKRMYDFVIATVIDEMIVSPALSDIYTQRSERLSNMKFTYGIHYSITVCGHYPVKKVLFPRYG